MRRRPGPSPRPCHRRRRRRAVVPQHGRRVPADPRRRRAPGDAPQPVVADAEGPDPRCRRVRRRARVRDGSSRARPRQAVAGRVPAGRRGPARPTSAERLPRSAFAMVGDDLRADVAAAKRVGLRGILVLSGKTSRADAERAIAGTTGRPARGRRARPTASPRRWPTWSPR